MNFFFFVYNFIKSIFILGIFDFKLLFDKTLIIFTLIIFIKYGKEKIINNLIYLIYYLKYIYIIE